MQRVVGINVKIGGLGCGARSEVSRVILNGGNYVLNGLFFVGFIFLGVLDEFMFWSL
jgi:hypothetical protein